MQSRVSSLLVSLNSHPPSLPPPSLTLSLLVLLALKPFMPSPPSKSITTLAVFTHFHPDYNIQMMEWESERESIAQNFAERAQRASEYMISSRASRRLRDEGEEANEQIEEFKEEIEKRYLLSVANKFYSFPYTELTFDNPYEDQELQELVGEDRLSLYPPHDDLAGNEFRQSRKIQKQPLQSAAKALLRQLRGEKQRLAQIVDMVNTRRNGRQEERTSRSKEKKLGVKYGVIREEEELLRKRLYTEPYEKQTGFILKKK